VQVSNGVSEVTALEKVQVWLNAELANVSAEKWIDISTEIYSLI